MTAHRRGRRDYIDGTWDPEHRDYFLVIAHNQRRWTEAQRARYTEQDYALAVEIAEETASNLDLYQRSAPSSVPVLG